MRKFWGVDGGVTGEYSSAPTSAAAPLGRDWPSQSVAAFGSTPTRSIADVAPGTRCRSSADALTNSAGVADVTFPLTVPVAPSRARIRPSIAAKACHLADRRRNRVYQPRDAIVRSNASRIASCSYGSRISLRNLMSAST